MLAAKNHQKIRSRYLVHEYSLKVSFNDFNHGYRAAVLKKNYPSLLPFYSLWLLIANIKWCAEWCAQQLYHTSLNSLIIEAKFGDDLLEILNISPKLSALFTLNDKNPETRIIAAVILCRAHYYPADIYLLKVNNADNRTRYEIFQS